MIKPRSIIVILFIFFLNACTLYAGQEAYSPYYIVGAASDSTATPTPFQPSGIPAQTLSQAPQATETIAAPLAPAPTTTPFPTSTAFPAQQPTPEVITQAQPQIAASDSINILLLGSDARSGASFRTDTILIASVRPKDGQVSLISIPRDLWVNIPTVGMQRINTAYQFGELSGYEGGGAGLLKATILFNLGVQIDHTAMIDFDGFRKVVDTIGGVDVPVACPYTDWRLLDPSLDPQDENNWFMYTAGPGLIHMNGDLALWYARARKHSNDFDRGRRQQEVIRAIYAQVLKSNLLAKIPQLYSDLSSAFTTDIGLPDILKLSPLALHMTNANIRSYYIAGDLVTSWITPGGAYVLLPNTELIQQMLNVALAPSLKTQERDKIKVEIQNGSPTDGWDALAAQRLNYAGYETSFSPADNRLHGTSLLYDLTIDQDRSRSASMLGILGLSQSALVSVPSKNNKVSYALIVGADYSACFDPASLTP